MLIYKMCVEVQQLLKYHLLYGHASPTDINNHKYWHICLSFDIEAVNGWCLVYQVYLQRNFQGASLRKPSWILRLPL